MSDQHYVTRRAPPASMPGPGAAQLPPRNLGSAKAKPKQPQSPTRGDAPSQGNADPAHPVQQSKAITKPQQLMTKADKRTEERLAAAYDEVLANGSVAAAEYLAAVVADDGEPTVIRVTAAKALISARGDAVKAKARLKAAELGALHQLPPSALLEALEREGIYLQDPDLVGHTMRQPVIDADFSEIPPK